MNFEMRNQPSSRMPRLLHGVNHPENFPVASVLLPRHLRSKVVAIYLLARFADDIADEGPGTVGQRLACLLELEEILMSGSKQSALEGSWLKRSGLWDKAQLHIARWRSESLDEHRLIAHEMQLMLSAFAWDARGFWPRSNEEFDLYCRGSAASVGRMMLSLFDIEDAESHKASDAICTALQRINMLQDCAVDARRGRIYIPANELDALGYEVKQWFAYCAQGFLPERLQDWIRAQAFAQSEQLRLHQDLHQRLPWRLALELKAIVAGGAAIARLLYDSPDPVRSRPRIGSALRGSGMYRMLRDWLFGLKMQTDLA